MHRSLSVCRLLALLLPFCEVGITPVTAQVIIAANAGANTSLTTSALSPGLQSAGSLGGSLSIPTGTQNLTALGTSDWTHWGLSFSTSFDHKASGGSQISNYTVVNGEAGQVANYDGNQIGFSWTDGTPDSAVTNTATGVYIFGAGKGFQVTVPAGASARTLLLYVGVYNGSGRLVAHLSDGTPDYVDTSLSSGGSVSGLYTIAYQAASAGQTLTLTWTYSGSGGAVNLQSAALAAPTAPDFTAGVQPSTQSVLAGNNTTYTVTVTPQNGFTGAVALTISGLPTLATASFTPSTIPGGSGASSLGITVPANVTPGSYPLTITATSGTLSHTAGATLVVTGPPDFTVGVQPSSQSVVQGNTTSYTVNVVSVNGFTGSVSLGLSGQPSNSTVSFSPSTITGGAGSSTLTITVASNATVTSYPLTVTATSGVLSHSAGAALNVTAAPPPDFTITLQPSSRTVTVGGNTTYTVTVAPVSGFSGTVSLGLTGQPGGATTSFTPASITGGNGSSALSITVASNTTPNSYTLTVTGTSSTLSHTATATLVVNAVTNSGLIGAVSNPVGTQNLTSLGTADWAHWGLNFGDSFDRKRGVTPQISNFSVINGEAGSVASYSGNPVGFTWSDGTPDTAVTNTTTGVYVNTVGRGFQITVPADTSVRTLTVFLGVFASQGKLVAHLSGAGAAPDFVDTSLSSSAFLEGAYTLQYAAASAGQTLTVSWTLNSGVGPNGGSGNIDIQSATLVLGGTLTPDFTTSVQPSTQNAGPGGTAAYTVTIASRNGFSGAVGLGLSGAPAGATVTFNPASVPGGSGTSNLSITVPSNATPNSYTLTITGTSGALVHTATATLVVTGPPDFSIGIQPSSQNVAPGNSTSYTVTITSLNGFTGGVSLLTSGLPVGVTPTFNPGSISGGSGTTNLTISVPSNITPNSYPFSVNATSGALNHSANATLMVIAGGSGPVLTASIFAPVGNQNLTALGTSDWADWGLATATDFNHKAGVTQQISNFTTVNTPSDAVVQTVDVVPNFTWTDGTPTQSVSPSGTAVGLNYAKALNTGFRFTAPADTTTRLLTAYVCVIAAQGTLTAHLSDGSVADYVDTSTTNGATLCNAYTFVYRANSPNQTLTLTWVMSQTFSPTSAIELEAATLSIVNPGAGFTFTSNPASQQILPGNSAAWALDVAPNAGFGASVTFSASNLPPGASSLFSPSSVPASGTGTVTISTTAATPPGTYTVNLIASAPGSAHSIPVTLVVINAAQPYLGAAFSVPSTSIPIDLTSVGSSDWAHWGLNFSSDFDDKASGGHQISNISVVNGQLGDVGGATGPLSFSWSDGTPAGTVNATLTGVYVKGLNVGFQITAPADTTSRTLTVYLGVLDTQGLLTAHLSDSSSPDYSDTSLISSGFAPGAYQIAYKASLPNQNLTVTFTLNSTSGPRCSEIFGVHCLVSLQSAALANH